MHTFIAQNQKNQIIISTPQLTKLGCKTKNKRYDDSTCTPLQIFVHGFVSLRRNLARKFLPVCNSPEIMNDYLSSVTS